MPGKQALTADGPLHGFKRRLHHGILTPDIEWNSKLRCSKRYPANSSVLLRTPHLLVLFARRETECL